jgi:hypothetical protein
MTSRLSNCSPINLFLHVHNIANSVVYTQRKMECRSYLKALQFVQYRILHLQMRLISLVTIGSDRFGHTVLIRKTFYYIILYIILFFTHDTTILNLKSSFQYPSAGRTV